MKSTGSPAGPQKDSKAESDPLKILSRIKLAFLDGYSGERRGYDPYDTSSGRVPDIWSAKRKRA